MSLFRSRESRWYIDAHLNKIVEKAIETALAAKPAWEAMPFTERASIFLKAADLLTTKYRVSQMFFLISFYVAPNDGRNNAWPGKKCVASRD